ncbi:MAG: hypothetical protein WD404_03085 [Solirubrobacterales bacterium]
MPDGPRLAGERGTAEALEGRYGEYRNIFRAMSIPGFPDSLEIGGVRISQMRGPVRTQRTEIRQDPGWRTVYEKTMRRVEVGHGGTLTAAAFEVPLSGQLSSQDLERWHAKVHAAIGVLVAILDERVALDEIAEDLIVFDVYGKAETAVDHVTNVREYPPANRILGDHRTAVEELRKLDLSTAEPFHAAARWYLRAAQEGPTAEAVVSLWIALEALSKPPYGTKLTREEKRLTDVIWVERALEKAGLDPAEVRPDVGRLAGLRAEIVHGGIEQPAILRDGFYTLEMISRLLLRHRLSIDVGWQLYPEVPNLRAPLRGIAMYLQHRFRRTEWIETREPAEGSPRTERLKQDAPNLRARTKEANRGSRGSLRRGL